MRSGTQDLGTGTYTVMTQIAADALGLPVEQVRFELGDTRDAGSAGLGRLADRGQRRPGGAGGGDALRARS